MTNLQQDHQYSLSNEKNNNKSVIFVKLTDSALKAIETFLSAKNDSSSKPTIQFQNNSGVISLPLNGVPHSYGFTLSNIEGDKLQSSFQCLQHINNSSLESLGFMFMKMQIHATEDSYENTKSKMTAADREQKNLCTKQIRQTATRVGNKVSVKRPGLMYVPEKTQSSAVKLEPTNLIQQPIRQRIIHILAAKSYKKAELLLRLKREGISDKDKEQINDILIEVAKLKGNVLSLEDRIWNEVQEDWEFSSNEELQFIKKKKQQLSKPKHINGVTGLSKPAVKQKSKLSIVEKTLLNKKLFQHVNEQGCKSIEKPNLPINGISQPTKKQCTSNNNIGSLFTSFVQQQHRTEETNGKNQEDMRMEITSNGNDIGQCELRPANPMTFNTVSLCKQTEHNVVSKIQVKQSNNYSGTNINRNGCTVNKAALEKIKLIKQELRNDSSLESHSKHIEKGNKVNGSCLKAMPIAQPLPKFDFSEIYDKYSKIVSLEQRLQYVKEFNNDCEEYVKLQTEMKEISERFSTLFNQLNACAEGSPEYKKMKIEIGKEYKRTSNDSYFASRKRFEFLKTKLSCIRKLILEYDKNMQPV